MLGVKFSEGEGITVPYPAMGGNHHGFIDFRGNPDAALESAGGSDVASVSSTVAKARGAGRVAFQRGMRAGRLR